MEVWEPGQDKSVLESTKVEAEEEEYNKDLEDRLYPLDVVELRRQRNAQAQRELALAEVALQLGLSLEKLERNRSVLSEDRDFSAFWVRWFREALANSEEAKRANRDFRKTPSPTSVHVVASIDTLYTKESTTSRSGRVKHRSLFAASVASESTVL
ncbi:LOW QUALITY PROTEIN: hypothetical protein PHMEG_000701 [Phytophthora megakarya]|uniref:Uncharacterized protein n=1 Tax=Phytophthora megakarya TaxID=4795 RepID=A0A225X2C8_9STRA|nr:LOW QUALITY PROTEIN: hypothetical protein PHMEG_000701 [Phytophthora megakarya]